MIRQYPHLTARIFNTPLLIHPGKLDAIIAGLAPRLGLDIDHAPQPYGFAPSASTGDREGRASAYQNQDGVAILNIFGVLAHRTTMKADSSMILGYNTISRTFQAALTDPSVRAIVLNIDSPGGEVAGVFELAAQIRAARGQKPIAAVASDLAASAAYLLASAADSISVSDTAVVGSIGVVMAHADLSKALEKAGIAVTHIYAGAHKIDGNPYEPLPEAVAEQFQANINHYYQLFINTVATYRKALSADALRATEAGLYIGANATAARLADRLETTAQAVSRLRNTPARGKVTSFSTTPQTPFALSACLGGFMNPDTDAITLDALPAPLTASAIAEHCLAAGEPALGRALLNTPLTEPQLQTRLSQAKDIRTLAARLHLPAEAEPLILAGIDPHQAARLLWSKDVERDQSLPIDNSRTITSGVDARDKFREGASLAIQARCRLAKPDPANEFRGFSLLDLARRSLALTGIDPGGKDKMSVVGQAFTHSSSDFPALLSNTAEKAMLKGFSEAPETFQEWTSTGSLADFKTASRVGSNPIAALREVPELAEIKYATMGEHSASIVLKTYAELFSISRQAIINDDLQAFSKIPEKFGFAAKRTVGDIVYALLTSNANAPDGVALFHTNHGNLLTSGGTAPTAAAVSAARAAMRRQSLNGVTLNITPAFLLTPVTLEDTALTLVSAQYDPAATTLQQPNPVRSYGLKVISDPRLDNASTTAWYLVAGQMFDTIEIAYLDGVETPFLDQQDGWTVDGTSYKVRLDFGAAILGHRTFYMNDGNA